MKKILIVLSILFCLTVQAQSHISGYVYEDTNNNGKKDRKETGIARVAVSNGKDVILTDDKGFYRLPVGDDNIIFVIKPSGYRLPLNENKQPKFYYIHKPKSNPAAFRYQVTTPTGELPKSLDFALHKSPESDNFTALVFGDPQTYTMEEIDYFTRGIVEEVKGIQNVSVGITLGDIAGSDLGLHRQYIQVMKQIDIPWHNVMGNHDMNLDAPADSLSDETFEMSFGPANYAFNYGKTHFILLDDILHPDPRNGSGYWGGFRKSQLDFIENDLKYVDKDKLIVLAFHIPLRHNETAFRPSDRQRLFDLLSEFPYTLSLSAHTHVQQQLFYGKDQGWRQEKPHHEFNSGTSCGDWYSGEINQQNLPETTMRDGTPQGYSFLRISGNQYIIDYKAAGKPKDYQMNIFCPKVVPHNERTTAGIYVNFFMGSVNDRVEYRIDNGEWQPMQYLKAPDPAFLDLLHRWDFTKDLMPGDRPSNAVDCMHLWRVGVPTKLSLGEHRVEVKATDMFGRTFTGNSNYRIEKAKNRRVN